MVGGKGGRGVEGTAMAVSPTHLVKDGDEHRRDILQNVFRLGAIEQGRVLPQLVRDLINNEAASVGQRFVRLLQESALFLNRQNAEGDSRKDVIAVRDAETFQFFR